MKRKLMARIIKGLADSSLRQELFNNTKQLSILNTIIIEKIFKKFKSK